MALKIELFCRMSNLVARVVSAFCIPVWQRGSLFFPREVTTLPDSQFMVFKRPCSNFSWCLHIKFYILNKIFCRSLGNRPVFLFVLIQYINTENTFVKWDHAVFVTDSSERFLSSFKYHAHKTLIWNFCVKIKTQTTALLIMIWWHLISSIFREAFDYMTFLIGFTLDTVSDLRKAQGTDE